jgi:hypothetical protein
MSTPRQSPSPSTAHFLSGSLLLAMILALLAMLMAAELAHAAPAPSLEQPVLPAAGTQQTLLTTEGFGRYAVLVRSRQGTALQLVDKMEGPGAVVGVAGERDGRLDLFLDRGTTKLLVHGHEQATGEVQLEVHAFDELNTGLAPLLEDLAFVRTELGDFQQRSWWIDLNQRERVVLEAAGRHLADLRLWRDGSWLVDATPACTPIDPVEGRPLQRCQLTTVLEPGLYLLSAYGGPGQPWSEDGPERPLYLRSGIPSLGDAGRQRGELSPFGEDRFRVPGAADLFRLELPEARRASLSVVDEDPDQPFRTGGYTARIVEESLPPVAEVTTRIDDEARIVTISGEAGQPYVLQHFPVARSRHTIHALRPFWLSTLHAGAAEDSLEPTAILVREHRRSGQIDLVGAEVVELREDEAFQRRFNLLETATLFVKVEESGTWAVNVDDPRAEITVEPFMVRYPEHYQRPDSQLGSSRWELDPGYHIVTIVPHRQGVAVLTIKPHGLLDSMLGLVGVERERELRASRGGARFPYLDLDPAWDYTLFTNLVPGVRMGLLQRELPLDLTQPLPLALGPGEELELTVSLPEAGTLRLVDDAGALLDIAADGKAWMRQPELRRGNRTLRLRNPGSAAVVATLWHEPASQRPGATPEPIGMDVLALLPEFPLITAEQPAFLDLERGQEATFRLRVDEPALYVLETTGLLATQGKVRTRTILSLASAAENGTGRNFMLQEYLGSGEYQVTIQARGRSRGHVGLRLRRTELTDGGTLGHGVPARASVPAGDGLRYGFSVAEQGRYEISAIGEQRGFRCRLEDGDGWPIERPGGQLPSTRDLDPGDYRLVLLPEPVDTRRVTSVSPVARELVFEGHGPHPLPLARAVAHTWHEPQDGGERAPDRWRFDLPARVPLSVSLGEDAAGEIFALSGDQLGERAARVAPGSGWQGELPAGSYELQARAARRDHGLPYRVLVQPEPLVVGTRRQLSAPTTVPVAVGDQALVELASVGDRDVRARLYAADGSLVAASDDRPEDWNFQLVQRLEPGEYQLRLDPVGDSYARTTVVMSAPSERAAAPLRAGRERTVEPGEHVLLVPLEGLGDDGVVAVRATSAESVGLALEIQRDGAWQPVADSAGRAALVVARQGRAEAWRLRLWSLDRRGNPVTLAVTQPSPRRSSEARAISTTELSAGRDTLPAGVPLKVSLDRPGLLSVTGDPVLWCPHPLGACVPVENGLVSPLEAELWLVATLWEPQQRASVSLDRVALVSGAEPTPPVRLGPGDQVLADLGRDLAGPVLVQASAVVGQPGVQVQDWYASPGLSPPGEGMDVGDRAAIAVSLDARDPALLAWDAGEQGGDGMELRLSATRFPAPLPEAAPPGSLDMPVPGGAARAWTLPAQPLRLRITLSAGLVAVLEGEHGLERVTWAQHAPREIELHSQARRLVVLNPGQATGRVAMDLIPAAFPPQALGFGQPIEQRKLRAGSFPLDLPPASPGETLHLRGAVTQGVIIDAQGRVLRGLDMPVPASGATVEVHHGDGVVLAWIDRPGQEGEGLWGEVAAPWVVDPATPSLTVMEGSSAQLAFAPERPLALHLRAPQPLVVGVSHGQEPLDVRTYPEAGSVDLLLPGGASTVLLRPLGEAQLRGELELSSTPITPIGEGLGPELILAPGDTRLFAFEVQRRGPVGVGVRAEADTVEVHLLDSHGTERGRGLAQMPTLDPGTWLLAVSLPSHAQPVRLQPAVVGIELPDTGPPLDVVQRYQRLTGGDGAVPYDELPFPGEPDHDEYHEYDEIYDEYDAYSEEW